MVSLVTCKTPCVFFYPRRDQVVECCCFCSESVVVSVACELVTPVTATVVAVVVVAVAATLAEIFYNLFFNTNLK